MMLAKNDGNEPMIGEPVIEVDASTLRQWHGEWEKAGSERISTIINNKYNRSSLVYDHKYGRNVKRNEAKAWLWAQLDHEIQEGFRSIHHDSLNIHEKLLTNAIVFSVIIVIVMVTFIILS